ncbi:hypothetical protein PABG_11325 [Paracoccidioides brasiliensis Pb03]|uniref:Uncharacterized protein n=2 Tax=Paracoccidioides brasiliensis TaxID=121759 RepID=A0A0A0HVS0_PARBD|nr:uncharacterized protein PADG_11677 [Paracoccidioides brasiliensis Pb18]KGM92141.1 hypothetical protein PADG_11677 [Paracoccidioides brasiliensis Pb18]KGY15672.1 hypothetical protein PABG_11325 [Paracoccidioides brasiliensis Pb03]ODH29893.1 hypothetical protein ACO22_03658 [Paracoccidioides brasiliensis]ODH50684.1 hypothetical protein GX48_03192 [Paracoccidioides brasiliensis]
MAELWAFWTGHLQAGIRRIGNGQKAIYTPSIKLKLSPYEEKLMAERFLWNLYDEPGNVSRIENFPINK